MSTTRGALSSAQQQHSRRTTTATEFVELSLSLCKMSPPVAAAAAGSASCCFVPALLAEQSSRRRWHARRGIRTAPEASSSAAAASKRLHAAATTATAPRRLPAARGTGPFFPSVRTRQKKHTSASHRASELYCASGALQLRKRAFRKPHALFFLLSFFAATATSTFFPENLETSSPLSSATANDGETATTAIVPDRARYHVFEMDGVDFLVGTSGDGRLDVRDAFVCDSTSSRSPSYALDGEGGAPTPSYSRAEGSDSPDLPQQPLPFVAVPWELRFAGDSLYKKPAWSKLLKVYLIAATRTEPSLRLDLTQVVSLDAATRSVKREEVVNRATTDDPESTTLRIR